MAIVIKPQGLLSRIGDMLMLPLMYLLQFPRLSRPQQTHFWNNQKYSVSDIGHLDSSLFVSVAGDQAAVKRWWGPLPIFHMPIIGGWKQFVVLQPKVSQDQWFIGWVPGDMIGISQIKLTGQVKLLRGPQTVFFFGLNEHGEQIELELIGSGDIRTDTRFNTVQFL